MPNPSSMGDLNRLIIQVARLHRARAQGQLAELGLYPGQEFIVMALLAQDGQSQRQLAAQLRVQPPTVSKMLARLEVAGVVVRHTSPHDQRLSLVYLSELGRSLGPALAERWQRLETLSRGDLSDDEVENLLLLLAKLGHNLLEVDDGGSDAPDAPACAGAAPPNCDLS
jgi:MarR family transcriptional regulator, organic hydroperoxide resistance regulator